ncbi:MAG TPA: thioredoxin domain-containing protein [Chloroflexi bacterium]|nr:thioredoxin domain-containing protein [Chloroflexota bacterium]
MTNRLAKETSPYLLQHADNPVDWYPWGEEAFRKARAEDKPIFLSIGYSACHWCHVMAHESFENEAIAAILNEHFVNIKVDREERPDVDRIYMSAVQAMTGGGGWPLSVFLTPEGVPFFGGTYFPPEPRHGLPAFPDVLRAVAEAWQTRRQEIVEGSQQVVEVIQQRTELLRTLPSEPLKPATLSRALLHLLDSFDEARGGWNSAPKFPQPMTLEFLLRYHHGTGEPQALRMAVQTLEAMARGGMYDQVGGGFHRYAVDDRWQIPHFEKMLYDNALLARVYLHAWQVTGTPLFRTVAEETLDFVLREMSDPQGGFYATLDADSEGEEGKFYLWTEGEIRQVLGADADRFLAVYDLVPFEGKGILVFRGALEERDGLTEARRQLLAARQQRVRPARDEKVITSWNGLMLAAYAEAGRVLGRADYLEAAERNADFLLTAARTVEGRVYHTWKEGAARVPGYLEDYTHLADGLLELYQATFGPRWYEAARELMDLAIEHFRAPDGGFFDAADDHEPLILRPRDLQDNATPSGNGMAAFVLLRLAHLAAEPRYAEVARSMLEPMQPLLARYPLGFGQWLIALDYTLASPVEVAVVGDPTAEEAQALLAVCFEAYRPCLVVAAGPTGAVPLLNDRPPVENRPTAYVCRGFTCLPPVTEPDALRGLLAAEERETPSEEE